MEHSKIEWTDHTFNPWVGCTKVGPGCDHCYAEAMMDNRLKQVNWGAGNPRKRTSEANWKLPLRWNREAEKTGIRPRVFCSSLADWLDNEVPREWLVDLLELIRLTPNLDWLLLSKRIGNWKAQLEWAAICAGRTADTDISAAETREFVFQWLSGNPPRNVWLGATVVNQEEAHRDAPKLLSTPAAVRFLSMEPLLGPVDFSEIHIEQSLGYFGDPLQWHHQPWCNRDEPYRSIDWIIVGGESGPSARPMQPDWVRNLRDQCLAAGTAFFFKQWGEYAPNWHNDDSGNKIPGSEWVDKMGKRLAGRALDGEHWDQFPGAELGGEHAQ